mmetsp:Transcript_30294/g.45047  ORF Transcript_30294/g.45047 Transcript_30294/m.45047 type:complete len:111 (-) Transcript_30294:403-735(-)
MPSNASSLPKMCWSKYSRNRTGYIALSVAPDTQLKYPAKNPALAPNASSTQATPPDASGKVDPSSAVIRASGIDHTSGNTKNPRRANKKPPACTDSSIPNGPPSSQKWKW